MINVQKSDADVKKKDKDTDDNESDISDSGDSDADSDISSIGDCSSETLSNYFSSVSPQYSYYCSVISFNKKHSQNNT